MNSLMKIGLFIPTYNAGEEFSQVLDLINQQSEQLTDKYIIDSSSTDNTVAIAKDKGFNVDVIKSSEFTHGKVRTDAAKKLAHCDYLIYMTQDVYLQPNAINELIYFIQKHETVGVAYGKQEVDKKTGNIFEERARQFNYGDQELIKTIDQVDEYGVKIYFSSDAFAIYNCQLLAEINFFDESLMFGEDAYAAAHFIKKGYGVGYVPSAKVFHTHKFSLKNEYIRYIEIGKFHIQNAWLLKEFGSNESEGIKMVLNETGFLIKSGKILLIPYAYLRYVAKYLGYRKGMRQATKELKGE